MIANLAKVDKWRSRFNPLRGLTMQRAVSMLEDGEAGTYADLQWTYRLLEKREATLRGLKRRRLAALTKLDWDIKQVDATPAAKQQADYLRAAYDRIENLRQALGFLALAEFRGFAHLEKVYQGDDPRQSIVRLEPVEQWHWVRDGLYGAWEYNAEARQTSRGTPVDLRHFLIREVEDPINEIGFICWLRKNLSQKDWDGFVEVYGIPPLFAEMPANVPAGKEGEYQEMAEAVVGDMRGVLPNGAKIQTVPDGARGTNPFRDHLAYQDEQIVMAGTSGKLTMLTAPAGLGGGSQGDNHQDTFYDLALAEAGEISEVFQAQLDKALLAARFPGQPVLAYFELAAKDQVDVGVVFDHAVKAKTAGLQMDAAELSEKTGYKLTLAPVAPPAAPGFGFAPTYNRDTPVAGGGQARDQLFRAEALRRLTAAQTTALRPLIQRIAAIADEEDDAKFDAALAKLREDLPALGAEILKGDATGQLAQAWESILGPALVSGAAEAAQAQQAVTKNRAGLLGWLRNLLR